MGHRIDVEGLTKTFDLSGDRLEVFSDLSFSVDADEFVVMLGPSGCGKTTLLKILAGTTDPTTGLATIDGSRIDGPSSSVAMVFQDIVLLPWKTVLENVAMGLKVQGTASKARRESVARTWVEKVGLSGFEHSYPTELSGGMKQRVGIARALAVDPEVLLMDEPFGLLDAQTKDTLQTKLLKLWDNQRKTVLFVTHDIDEAIYMADRILVLSEVPAEIQAEYEVGFDRQRWNNRLEIEQSEEFGRLKKRLREELNLLVE